MTSNPRKRRRALSELSSKISHPPLLLVANDIYLVECNVAPGYNKQQLSGTTSQLYTSYADDLQLLLHPTFPRGLWIELNIRWPQLTGSHLPSRRAQMYISQGEKRHYN